MKLFLPVLSFLLGNAKGFFKEPSIAITQQVIQHARSITILVVSTMGSLALSCVGLSLFIVNLANQLDSSAEFHFTAGTYLYLGMTIIFAGLLVWALRRDTWMKAVGLQEKQQTKKVGSPIENAVALLVMDFLEERKNRRESPTNKSE